MAKTDVSIEEEDVYINMKTVECRKTRIEEKSPSKTFLREIFFFTFLCLSKYICQQKFCALSSSLWYLLLEISKLITLLKKQEKAERR